MNYLHGDFLLDTAAARRLFHDYAATEPILDYHNHLPPAQVAADHRFRNLWEVWLAGDHYKWRALRTNGVPERLITGDAPEWEKFLAWARTVPRTLRNPLHHWTHLELQRTFGITSLLDEHSARRIWDQANEQLASPEFGAAGLLRRFKVAALCTTDDPADPLPHHERHRSSGALPKMYPTFRADGAFAIDNPAVFQSWCARLAATTGSAIADLPGLLAGLQARHRDFHALGGRLSDHGLESVPEAVASEEDAARWVAGALAGIPATRDATAAFCGFLLRRLAALDAAAGWTKQLHLGALRRTNNRLTRLVGADCGVDSIGDFPQARGLARLLDDLETAERLPKMVLYNLNPADNYVFATMAGNFQSDAAPGRLQFGSGWWFLDQLEGMEWQINALSQLGLLSRFVGMLTDSRSFLSFPRHEYFRRLLCRLLGRDLEAGLLPDDTAVVGGMVRDICYGNACSYFGLEV